MGRASTITAFVAGALSLLEDGINKLQGPKERAKWLWGNFEPISYPGDLFAPDLKVEGVLPPEVTGVFVRNGPNPVFIESGYHWFDGDGFIHAVKLDSTTQSANYSGQFVKTSKLSQEVQAGRALFDKLGDLTGPLTLGHILIQRARVALKVIDTSKGRHPANTALLYHAGQLFALHEGEQPHLLRIEPDGRVGTVGLVHKAGKEPGSVFTAHPKVDPVTKRLYAFEYKLNKKPYLTFYQLDEEGQQVREVPLDFSHACMTHDFAITANFAIFFEPSLYLDPKHLFNQKPLFSFDENKPMRFAVLPLDATSAEQTQWFEAKPGYIFHTANAWEEDGGKRIHVLAARYEHFELSFDGTMEQDADKMRASFSRQELDERAAHLYEFVLDRETGDLQERRLVTEDVESRLTEFPQVHPRLLGRRSRFVYMAAYDARGEPAALLKVDLEGEGADGQRAVQVQHLDLGEQTFAGEALFIPRAEAESEDDGYLLTFTYSYKTNSSDFRIYDAKAWDAQPVARIPLPRRVPYGFHAVWVPQAELERQNCPASLAEDEA